MSAILTVHNLHKSFGALKVTDGVSLDVREGECHALIGPNGAGKSTFVNQLAGSLAPDEGSIAFEGEDVTHLPVPRRAQRGLGRTYQITSLIKSFSVLENVALAAQARAGSSLSFFAPAAREETLNAAARNALETVGLAGRADAKAADLSHGECRLLEIAVALAGNPKLLLLDEPMAGMGKAESETLTTLLKGLKTRVPMLLVEHDMEAVFALADRISLLVEGRLVAAGTPDALRADPAARAAYLGDEVV
ncbi:MAG: ABC transporter ATP-binding protein [Pseudomonadota bacterium]